MLPPGSLSACCYDVTVDGASSGIDCLEDASPAVLISNDGGNVQGSARLFALTDSGFVGICSQNPSKVLALVVLAAAAGDAV